MPFYGQIIAFSVCYSGARLQRGSSGLTIKTNTKGYLKDWLSALVRKPSQIGAVLPSSAALGRAMAGQLNGHSEVVVEIGAGTGAITKAILGHSRPPQRLIIVEKHPDLCDVLKRRFGDVEVVNGDAADVASIAGSLDIEAVDAVVSSLPLLNLGATFRHALLESVFSCLRPDGALLQYTYGGKSPIPQRELEQRDIIARKIKFVPWNVPPATVWRYSREEPAVN